MKKTRKNNSWGGKREGAGRVKLFKESTRVTTTVPLHIERWLKELGGGNSALGARTILINQFKNKGNVK